MQSALDRACEKYGCAKVFLDPKLHSFDDCFGGAIRMGDIDAAVERKGHILWVEWKRGAIIERFDDMHRAQIQQAKSFTSNSNLQTFVFVLGCPVKMEVDAFRIMQNGKWPYPWQHGGIERFKGFLKWWFAQADGQHDNKAVVGAQQ